MISFVRGVLFAIEKEHVIIEAAGLGYQVAVTEKTISNLPALGSPVLLHTYMQVLENEFKLYGFLDNNELNLFLRITAISGMGSRAALNILGRLTPADFYQTILNQDEKTLTTIPGIGKKSAQRLLFEFKDKIEPSVWGAPESGDKGGYDELLEALAVLGYQRSEIMPLLMELKARNELELRLEDNIKKILRYKALAMK